MTAETNLHGKASVLHAQPWGRYLQIVVSLAALVGLLSYTFIHTSGLISRYIEPPLFGYFAALGVELAIVALSMRIGAIKRGGQNPWFFYGVLAGTLILSAIANIYEGYSVRYEAELSVADFRPDVIGVVVGLAATLAVPLIVFALSEIIGSDVQQTARSMEKQRRAKMSVRPGKSGATGIMPTPEQAAYARSVKAVRHVHNQSERRQAILGALADDPKPNMTELANVLGIGRTTLYEDLQVLQNSGRLRKNGQGWEVVA